MLLLCQDQGTMLTDAQRIIGQCHRVVRQHTTIMRALPGLIV
jgi:hypothetical protein